MMIIGREFGLWKSARREDLAQANTAPAPLPSRFVDASTRLDVDASLAALFGSFYSVADSDVYTELTTALCSNARVSGFIHSEPES